MHSKEINPLPKKLVEKESSNLANQLIRTKLDIETTESEVSTQLTFNDDIHHLRNKIH
jgi:hypothetical protein